MGTQEECLEFISFLNQNNVNVRLTHTISPWAVEFLDLRIEVSNGHLETNLYRKSTATNSLLHYSSFHPRHTLRGIPTGQFLRVRRNCSRPQDFKVQALDLTNRFKKRGYPKSIISQAYQRANGIERRALLEGTSKRLEDNTLRFVATYNNQWQDIRKILGENWNILLSDNQVRNVIPERPMLVSRRAPNLRDLLTRSHFQRPTRTLGRGFKHHGSYPCGDCTACQFMTPKQEFTNPRNGKSYHLKNYINCKTSQVIYTIICPCGKLYVGQTGQQLRKRIQKHLSTIALARRDKDRFKTLTTVANHFLEHHGGRPYGLQVIGLERIMTNMRGGPITQRLLQVESKWIFELGTVSPWGMNEDLLFTGFLGRRSFRHFPVGMT
ncbi:uncharacterized protein LOC130360909 [Hyla sarda]|uniref:uncharacterized protein LOC130360909 n=1 Tax=Hyla sarda TaxID=327740 RepID=UPI0024C3D5C3|nr:uncharacterized protein LOC130360909 [Hyla sarda]